MRPTYRAVVLVVAALATGTMTAGATQLFLDDWGISYGQWTPNGNAPENVTWVLDDWVGGGDGFLDPGYGGQEYDVEATYLAYDNSFAYIGIVTGFPLAGRTGWNGYYYQHFAAGDIGIDMNDDDVYDYAVDTSAGGALRWGDLVWQDPHLAGQPAWGGAADPLLVTAWQNSSPIEAFRYGAFDGRYSIEAIIDREALGFLNESMMIHWTMGCGNDLAEVDMAVTPVPEPATLMLLGGGLMLSGIAARSRRKKK